MLRELVFQPLRDGLITHPQHSNSLRFPLSGFSPFDDFSCNTGAKIKNDERFRMTVSCVGGIWFSEEDQQMISLSLES